jgi:acid phosphatase type 7
MLRRLRMRSPRYRAASVGAILTLAALVLALADGRFSSSRSTPRSEAFVASDARNRTTVWAVGDGPDGGPNARRVARLIERSKPNRMLYLGDVYDDGTPDEFAHNFEPIYGRIARRIAPTPGNHDWPNHERGYDAYWKRKHGKAVRHYYSFRTGGWQILSLDSEMDHDAESPQAAWLRSAVRGRGTCRIAFWHRPRYSAGDRHGDQEDVQPLWDVLEGHAAIVVNGHEHDMQRFHPRHGITEFVSGAGGHGLYGIERHTDLAYANETNFGALRLDLAAGVARYRFVSVRGRTLDSGKLRCRTH